MQKKTQWSRSDKVLMTTIGIVILLAVLGVLLFENLNMNPVAVIPTPKMPSPNAFDYFVAAGNAVMDDKKIGYAASYTHYAPSTHDPYDRTYSLTEKQALVAENAEALKLLHQGFAYPYQNPPARSFAALFPYYAKFRGMARLLSLEGTVKAADGDWNGAVQSDLDAIQLGEMIPHGGVLIGDLVGIACQAIGRRPLWKEIDSFNTEEAKRAAQRLEHLQSLHQSFADTLQEEKWSGQAGLLEIFHGANWQKAFADSTGGGDNGENNTGSGLRLALLVIGKKRIFKNYTHYMDQTINNARQPYAAKPAEPTIPNDPIDQVLLPVFSQGYLKDVDSSQTQNALLTVALALRAYKGEHGAYPDTLGQLVPSYLTHVPDDPFALSGPLHYKRQGKKYVLYSVGPDGVDNDGEPIFDASQKPPSVPGGSDQRYYVKADSKGDIVAGVNIF